MLYHAHIRGDTTTSRLSISARIEFIGSMHSCGSAIQKQVQAYNKKLNDFEVASHFSYNNLTKLKTDDFYAGD